MNCANQVFAITRVDSGFSSDGTVHHRQQRRGNLNMRNTAMINRRHKSGDIADHAAAEPNRQTIVGQGPQRSSDRKSRQLARVSSISRRLES